MKGARIIASLFLSLLLIGTALLVTQSTGTSYSNVGVPAYAQTDYDGCDGLEDDCKDDSFSENFFFPSADEGFVPCGRRGEGNVIIDEPCTICHAGEMGQNIINFIIRTIVPVIAILIAAWGGFEILTAGGNEEKYKSGRNRLVKVVIGVLIVLLAWAAINFFLYTFFKDDVIGKWNQFDCSVEGTGPVTGVVPKAVTIDARTDTPEGGVSIPDDLVLEGDFAVRLSESAARAFLASKGISVSSGVRLEGIRQSTLNELVTLKSQCGCALVVTGGTGSGHASGTFSHTNGFKIDVRSHTEGQALTDYIRARWRRIGTRSSDGAAIYLNPVTGNQYALETSPPHWDILVVP